jgi:hypothetical protein
MFKVSGEMILGFCFFSVSFSGESRMSVTCDTRSKCRTFINCARLHFSRYWGKMEAQQKGYERFFVGRGNCMLCTPAHSEVISLWSWSMGTNLEWILNKCVRAQFFIAFENEHIGWTVEMLPPGGDELWAVHPLPLETNPRLNSYHLEDWWIFELLPKQFVGYNAVNLKLTLAVGICMLS